MASEKTAISENIQKFIGKADWKAAIAEMEKLFALEKDPITRVRIGDAHQKLNQKGDAVREYVRAADLYAENGFVVKALAQYKLALRLDPNNRQALDKMAALHTNKSVTELKLEPVELGEPTPTSSVVPLFADLTQDEFNEFTKRMVVHNNVPVGKTIIKEGEAGSSVFVLTRGAVGVFTMAGGKRVDLAVLQPSDFFGEIAFLTGKPRTATVETTDESDLLEVPEEELADLISQRPRIREVLQKYYEQRVQSTLEKVKGAI
jgi:tetratricopeptide (TPR) repeat protein